MSKVFYEKHSMINSENPYACHHDSLGCAPHWHENMEFLLFSGYGKAYIDQEIYNVEPGDIVVTVSDGVVDSKRNVINKEFWISGFLRDLEITEPEVIAEELLEKTIENYGGVVKDDITIIVQKLVKS